MEELRDWCLAQLGEPSHPDARIEPLSGDASFRRYFRLWLGQASLIAVDAPPSTERNEAFVQIAGVLHGAGVRVPEVKAVDFRRGFLLLTDLGDQLLLPLLDAGTVDRHYGAALDTLARIQGCPLPGGNDQLPEYDAALLGQEMALMPEWFLGGLLQCEPGAAERELLTQTFSCLTDSALAQPRVLVHRDFHSRNLMLMSSGDLAVIDFQDAVSGPLTYDAVSLLRDCYVAWPEKRVEHWLGEFRSRLLEAGRADVAEPDTFRRWFDWMGLQRHIKVLGIFARLWLRDGKSGYLPDLPLVMHYTLSVAQRYPELQSFSDWLASEVWPRAHQQAWYREPEIRA